QPEPPNRDSVAHVLKKILGGTIWTAGATVVQLCLQLLVLAVLGRLLTPADFGLVGIATSVAAFATLVGQFGLGQAIIQASTIDKKTIRTAFTLCLAGGSVVGLLLVLASGAIGAAFQEPAAIPYIRVVAVSVLAI